MRSCFLYLLLPFALEAAVLDDQFDLDRLKGRKLGYYIGSFDPIHVGHQHVVEEALRQQYVDYVLIYPVPGSDPYKNRTDLTLRLQMVASIYQQHPNVLVTSWTPKELQDRFSPLASEIEVVGIVGSDVVTEVLLGPDKDLSEKYRGVFMRGIPLKERHYTDTFGALMALHARSFIISLRGAVDLSYLNGKIDDRSIQGFIQSKEISSTQVKAAINHQKPFEQLLAPSVEALIKEQQLYGFDS